MDFNGNVAFSGGGTPVLSGVGPTTASGGGGSGGEDGQNKKGVLTFPNGFKIQWDTVWIATSDTATSVTLQSGYTEAGYGVLANLSSEITHTVAEAGVAVWMQANDPKNKINIEQLAASGPHDVTYVSWGKDTV